MLSPYCKRIWPGLRLQISICLPVSCPWEHCPDRPSVSPDLCLIPRREPESGHQRGSLAICLLSNDSKVASLSTLEGYLWCQGIDIILSCKGLGSFLMKVQIDQTDFTVLDAYWPSLMDWPSSVHVPVTLTGTRQASKLVWESNFKYI